MNHPLTAFLVFLFGFALPAGADLARGSWSNNGPEGVSAPKLYPDPSNRSILYLVGEVGLYKSTDGGESWSRIMAGGHNFAISPSNPNVLLWGGADDPVRSGDQGQTWTRISYPPPSSNVSRAPFLFDPKDDRTAYLVQEVILGRSCFCSVGQVFRSIDGGNTWVEDFQAPSEVGAYPKLAGAVIDPRSTIWFFGSVLYRRPAGANYRVVLSAPVSSLAVDPLDPARVYAGGPDGLYLSTDGGDSWTFGTLPGNVAAVLINPANPAEVFAKSDADWFRSENHGLVWTPYSTGGTDLLAFSAADPFVVYGNNGSELRKSVNHGLNWRPIVRGLVATTVSAFVSDPRRSGHLYASVNAGSINNTAMTKTDIFETVDAGRTWTRLGQISAPGVQSLAFDPASGSLYAGTDSGVFGSADGGRSWRPLLLLAPSSFWATVSLAPRDPGTVFFGGALLFRSDDAGSSWNSTRSIFSVSTLAVDPGNAEVLYANGYDGKGFGGLLKSSDGGANWMRLLPGGSSLRTLVIDPVDPRNVYTGDFDVLGSSDAGATWRRLNDGLSGCCVASMATHPVISGRLYLLDDLGRTFQTLDYGSSWRIVPDLPHMNSATALAIESGGEALFVATSAEGVWTFSPLEPRVLPPVQTVPFRR